MSAQRKRILSINNNIDNENEPLDDNESYTSGDENPFEKLKNSLYNEQEDPGQPLFNFNQLEVEDRRGGERRANPSFVIIYDENLVAAKGKLNDISSTGLSFVTLNSDLKSSKEYRIEIIGSTKLPPLFVSVEIYNKNDVPNNLGGGVRYGCMFTKISRLTEKKLNEYLSLKAG